MGTLLRPNTIAIYRRTSTGVSSTGDRVPAGDTLIVQNVPAYVDQISRGGQIRAEAAGIASYSTHVLIIDGVPGRLVPSTAGPGAYFTGPDGVTTYRVTGNGDAGQIDMRVGDKVIDENGFEYLVKLVAMFDEVAPTLQAQLEIGAAWHNPPPAPAPPPTVNLPAFSWTNIPLSGLMGKSQSAPFTSSEIGEVATVKPIVFCNIHSGNTGYWEDQSAAQCAIYKAANPGGKWIFYVGFHGQRPQCYWYWTVPGAQPSWIAAGGGNVDDPAFRDWWTTAIATMLTTYSEFDGVLIDSLGPGFDANKYALVAELRMKLPAGKILVGNCFPSLTPGATYFDGNALHMAFGEGPIGRSTDPVQVKQWIDAHIAFGKAGWPQIMQMFPGFSFLDQTENPSNWPATYGARLTRARLPLNMDFAVAAGLVCAYSQTYLSYSWGYDSDGGGIALQYDPTSGDLPANPAAWLADAAFYPDFVHALGAPLGDATHPSTTGGLPGEQSQIYIRRFPHATVTLNLNLLGQVGQSIVSLT
jgi:hypothetical protein